MIMVLHILLCLNVKTMGIFTHEPQNKSLVIWNILLKNVNVSMKKVAVCPFYVPFFFHGTSSNFASPFPGWVLTLGAGGGGGARPLSRRGESVGLGRGLGGVPVWSCVGWSAEIEEMVKKWQHAWWLMTDTAEKTHAQTQTHAYTNKEH